MGITEITVKNKSLSIYKDDFRFTIRILGDC